MTDRDLTGEYIRRNAAAAAAPNPLFPDRRSVADDPPPTPTGDVVTDFIQKRNWAARRAPNPLRQVAESFKRLPQR